MMIQPFDYDAVTLLNCQVLDALKETEEFYKNIPMDRFFKYMRRDAGFDAPGKPYTGWFVNSRGGMLTGQFVSAFSRMYAATGVEDFRNKAVDFFEEYMRCYRKLAGTPKELLGNTSFYDYEKLLRAIIDLTDYAHYKEAADALPVLLDFADRRLTQSNLFGDNLTEWYTMPESLLAVYETFGIEKARDLAFRWEYRSFWDLFYRDQNPFSRRPEAGLYSEFCHAYSHVNSFNSCAEFFRVTKDPYYLCALRKFYRFMQSEEVMATGGYGPDFEHIMPKYRIVDALRAGHDSFETQCDTYAAFRLSKNLTVFTGEAQYGNWPELLIWNAALSTIPMTEEGNVIYYSDYNMYGATKENRADGWTCCTGTRPLLMMEIPRLIYFHSNKALYIDQFIPSRVRFSACGKNACLVQKTEFPAKDTIRFFVEIQGGVSAFSLKWRMPSWLEKKLSLRILDVEEKDITQRFDISVDDQGWLCACGAWPEKSTAYLTLPQALSLKLLDPMKKGPAAFMHGPIALAASYTGPQTPNDAMDLLRILPEMIPDPENPLHFHVRGRDDILFKPFFEYREHEKYFIYHDTCAHRTDRFAK